MLGLSTNDMMRLAGHGSNRTNLVYQRGDVDGMLALGMRVQEFATGIPLQYPDTESVEMLDGSIRRVKDILPFKDENDKVVSRAGVQLGYISDREIIDNLGKEDEDRQLVTGQARRRKSAGEKTGMEEAGQSKKRKSSGKENRTEENLNK